MMKTNHNYDLNLMGTHEKISSFFICLTFQNSSERSSFTWPGVYCTLLIIPDYRSNFKALMNSSSFC